MLYTTASNETPQAASVFPGSAFHELITSECDSGSSEAAIALLQKIAREQECENWGQQYVRSQKRPYENSSPLQQVPPSPWRSLGGYFDYTHWVDRDRFMELDRIIAANQLGQVFEVEPAAEMF